MFDPHSSLTDRSRHLKTHTKPFHCETCKQGFALRSDLGRHIKSRHRAVNEQYRCHFENCAFKSNRKDNLKKHQRKVHSSELLSRPVEKSDDIQSSQQHSEVVSTAQLYSASIFMQVAASGDLNRLKVFLDAGLTVETETDDRCTALHCAARAGQTEVVRYLLLNGANAIARNQGGRSPIHEAVLSNSPETLDCLLRHMTQEELRTFDKKLGTSMKLERYLIQSGSIEIVDVYLARLGSEFTDRDASKKLSFAIRAGHYSLLATLLDDPNINTNGRISIQSVSFAPIHLAARYGQTKVMKILIACDRVDKTLTTYGSRQALHIAASRGHTAIVKHLISHSSVDINCQDDKAATPLHYASSNGHTTVVQQLLSQSNTHCDCKDKNLATPLHYAVSSGHWETASLLLKHSEAIDDGLCISSDVSPTSPTFTKEDLLHRLFKHPDFGGPNKKLLGTHRTILQVAVKKGDCEVIEILLACQDIDVIMRDIDGWSPLMNAARYGGFKVVQLLLQHKYIDVNQSTTCWRRETALQYAKMHKNNEIVDLLLAHGAIDYDAKAPPTGPTTTHIDDSQNTTLQPDHETHFDPFDDNMDDVPTEAWEEFLAMEEGVEE